jgi:hypothetical protein
MLLCEGQDIEEKLVFAEDLISFLAQQVGSVKVDTLLGSPEAAPCSMPTCRAQEKSRKCQTPRVHRPPSVPVRKALAFYIGDGEPEAATPDCDKRPCRRRAVSNVQRPVSMPSRKAQTFYIGDLAAGASCEKASGRRPVVTDYRKPQAFDLAHVCSTDEGSIRNSAACNSCNTPRRLRNLLAQEDSSASTECPDTSSPVASEVEYSTPVKSKSRPSRLADARQHDNWKSWVLFCAARGARESLQAFQAQRSEKDI